MRSGAAVALWPGVFVFKHCFLSEFDAVVFLGVGHLPKGLPSVRAAVQGQAPRSPCGFSVPVVKRIPSLADGPAGLDSAEKGAAVNCPPPPRHLRSAVWAMWDRPPAFT